MQQKFEKIFHTTQKVNLTSTIFLFTSGNSFHCNNKINKPTKKQSRYWSTGTFPIFSPRLGKNRRILSHIMLQICYTMLHSVGRFALLVASLGSLFTRKIKSSWAQRGILFTLVIMDEVVHSSQSFAKIFSSKN